MFEHLTLTLAQQDGPPPPPSAVAGPAAPAASSSAAPGAAAQGQAAGQNAAATASGNNTTATTTANGQAVPAKPKSSPFGDPIMILALAVLAFMFFFTMSSSRKEKKKRKALASSLKKGSKVRTVGGIIGTISDLRDDGSVVIKVDENANTRIKFDRSAVTTVIDDKTV